MVETFNELFLSFPHSSSDLNDKKHKLLYLIFFFCLMSLDNMKLQQSHLKVQLLKLEELLRLGELHGLGDLLVLVTLLLFFFICIVCIGRINIRGVSFLNVEPSLFTRGVSFGMF